MKKILLYMAIFSTAIASFVLLNRKEERAASPALSQVRITEVFAKDLIKPPLKDLDIVLKSEKIQASSGKTIRLASGTTIAIPPNAFVDGKGNLIKGKVDFSYREFSSRMDIFLSGIPMTFEKAQLESAGMIELQASFNSKPVFVNPKNKIAVEMASKNQAADFNLYFMDRYDQTWKLKKKNMTVAHTGKQQMEKVKPEEKKKAKLIKPRQSFGRPCNLRVNTSRFPEIAPYRNIMWMVPGESYNGLINGTRQATILNRIGETDSFMIRIQGPISYVDQIFYPVFKGEHFQAAMRVYDGLGPDLEEEERLRKELESKKQEGSSEANLYRSFAVDGMGIYNCDRVSVIAAKRIIHPMYVDAQNKEINVQKIFVADKKVNTVFELTPEKIPFSRTGDVTLWTVLEDGRIGVFRNLQKLSAARKQTLKLEISKGPVKTVAEVKAMLGEV